MTGCCASNRCVYRPITQLDADIYSWRPDARCCISSPSPFSSQNLIWTSVFLAISSSHTDHVAQGHRGREGGKKSWQCTQGETSKSNTTDFPPPGPALPYITFLALLTYSRPCCFFVFLLLKCFVDCQVLGDSSQTDTH